MEAVKECQDAEILDLVRRIIWTAKGEAKG